MRSSLTKYLCRIYISTQWHCNIRKYVNCSDCSVRCSAQQTVVTVTIQCSAQQTVVTVTVRCSAQQTVVTVTVRCSAQQTVVTVTVRCSAQQTVVTVSVRCSAQQTVVTITVRCSAQQINVQGPDACMQNFLTSLLQLRPLFYVCKFWSLTARE